MKPKKFSDSLLLSLYHSGASNREIADRLDVTEPAVLSRLQRLGLKNNATKTGPWTCWYLAGPIGDCKTEAEFIDWRNDMKLFLEGIGMSYIDPVETSIEIMNIDNPWELLTNLRKEGKFSRVHFIMNSSGGILEKDYNSVVEADGIIAYVPEYTVGTVREISLAHLFDKPVLTVCPIEFPNNSLIGMSTHLFREFDHLKNWLTHYWEKNIKS
ncbi:MAG: AsnC family protein [Candidatus Methanofastidiosia archaeon]|jgi:hypothetical protein